MFGPTFWEDIWWDVDLPWWDYRAGWRPVPWYQDIFGVEKYTPPPTVSIPPPPAPAPPLDEEEDEMAHDWGHLARQVAEGFIGGGGGNRPYQPVPLPFLDIDTSTTTVPAAAVPSVTGGLGPESCEGMVWSGGTPPKGYKVVNWCGKGVLRKVRRRRRRRILTASDKADISYIVSTTGKGQLAASLIHKSTH